ncbi:MAG: hypothetical protein ACOYVK_14945 [Bacillota bacterium]
MKKGKYALGFIIILMAIGIYAVVGTSEGSKENGSKLPIQNEGEKKEESTGDGKKQEQITDAVSSEKEKEIEISQEKKEQEEIIDKNEITEQDNMVKDNEENKDINLESSKNTEEPQDSMNETVELEEKETTIPVYEEVDGMYSEEGIKYMRSDDQNDVTVDVIFQNPSLIDENTADYWVFQVLMNTHSYEISEGELNKKLMVKSSKGVIESKNVLWVPEGGTEGHHVSGKILIPKTVSGNTTVDGDTQFLEIEMKGVAGAEKRVFRWTKDELDFGNLQ